MTNSKNRLRKLRCLATLCVAFVGMVCTNPLRGQTTNVATQPSNAANLAADPHQPIVQRLPESLAPLKPAADKPPAYPSTSIKKFPPPQSRRITEPAAILAAHPDVVPTPSNATQAPIITPVAANDPAVDTKQMEALQKQIDIQQQQLETLHKMMGATSHELQRQRDSVAESMPQQQQHHDDGVSSHLQASVAQLQAAQHQAMVRDSNLASHIDSITERFDSYRREMHPSSTSRELHLPTRFNQSPIVHYGQLAFTFDDFEDSDGNFASPTYFPRFLMLLNEQLVLDVNLFIESDDIQVVAAELDWHLHDNLSLTAGRFYSPFGFFGERLQTGWVWKSIDIPLMFNQIHPTPASQNGVMARGAVYPTTAPIKLEYTAFLSNGLSLNLENGDQKDFADLNASREVFNDVNGDKAVGGRVGLSNPERGIMVGMSGMANGAYDPAGEHDLSMWGVDFSLHRGNWDFRYEFIQVDQQSPFGPIDREGMYAQVAYRDYESLHPIRQRLEYVFRFDTVDFAGIDLTATGLDFGTRENLPVDRNRWLAQVNFYATPSLLLKLGYEILDEQGIDEIDDNGISAQILWGF